MLNPFTYKPRLHYFLEMKILIFISVLILFSFNICSFSQDNVEKSFFTDKRVHDFGEIQEKDGKVSHTFIFTNTTKVPIVINGTHSGCGCASSEYSKRPIKPGETGEVTITYNPAHRPGFFSKEVVIYFNNGKDFTRIWIKGTVISFLRPVEEDHPYNFGRGLYCSLKVLPFGTVIKGESKEIKMFYANDTEKEMELTFIVEGNHSNITFVNPGKLAPKERGNLKFKYTSSSKNLGLQTFNIYPYVNGKRLSKPLVVSVTEVNN